MNNEWGIWHDPDTDAGLQQYQQAGLTLSTPHDNLALNAADRYHLAEACGELLMNVYKGNYPHDKDSTSALAESIAQRETNLFTLAADEKLVAMGSLIRRNNAMRGPVQMAELSKLAKRQGGPQTEGVSARFLSKFRLPWTFQNIPEIDFAYSSPRAAAAGTDGAPGGKQAQSVWWGGRKRGVHLPILASNVGWNFKVGGVEPLSGLVAPARPAEWANAVQEYPLLLPDDATKQQLDTLFTEGTNGKIVLPSTVVDSGKTKPFALREARPPSPDIVAKYYLTTKGDHMTERTIADVDEQLADTISQKVIVETDMAATKNGAAAMQQLLSQGWSFTGWQPSEMVYGGVCPVFARVNPTQVDNLIEPRHYPQYFDAGGLAGTRQVLDNAYQTMRQKALQLR